MCEAHMHYPCSLRSCFSNQSGSASLSVDSQWVVLGSMNSQKIYSGGWFFFSFTKTGTISKIDEMLFNFHNFDREHFILFAATLQKYSNSYIQWHWLKYTIKNSSTLLTTSDETSFFKFPPHKYVNHACQCHIDQKPYPTKSYDRIHSRPYPARRLSCVAAGTDRERNESAREASRLAWRERWEPAQRDCFLNLQRPWTQHSGEK